MDFNRLSVAIEDFSDAGPCDESAVVCDDSETDRWSFFGSQPAACESIAGSDRISGFDQRQVGDLCVIHLHAGELETGFEDREHARVAKVLAVRDVEVFERGFAGGSGDVFENGICK